jgi:hypothetical protein
MGKKSKKARSNNKPKADKSKKPMDVRPLTFHKNHTIDVICSLKLLHDTVKGLSLHDLREFHTELTSHFQILGMLKTYDLSSNMDERKNLEEKIMNLPVGPFGGGYQELALKELKRRGGIKVVAIPNGRKSFAYTVGFTNIGGKELLLQKIHRSMVSLS